MIHNQGATKHNGCLITFEGLVGTHRKEVIEQVEQRLVEEGIVGPTDVHATEQPPQEMRIGRLFSEELRRGGDPSKLLPMAFAMHEKHCKEVIKPTLDDGGIVFCDRYVHTTAAYHGAWMIAKHPMLPYSLINDLEQFSPEAYVIYLDILAGEAVERMQQNPKLFSYRPSMTFKNDMEVFPDDLSYLDAVRGTYFAVLHNSFSPVSVICASAPLEMVVNAAFETCVRVIEQHRKLKPSTMVMRPKKKRAK